MSHTPGPWTALVHGEGNVVDVVAPNVLIAICGEGAKAEANAALIAVTPELLAFAEDVATNWDHDDDAHRYKTPCRACGAEALVKKARGGA